jgi:hypothetical protein
LLLPSMAMMVIQISALFHRRLNIQSYNFYNCAPNPLSRKRGLYGNWECSIYKGFRSEEKALRLSTKRICEVSGVWS